MWSRAGWSWVPGLRRIPQGQRRAGVPQARGGLGLQGHRAVLIQRHRSDRMRAINYCDKMQSWPAHCRRADRSLSPAPHWSHAQASAGMPLPTSLSIAPTTHTLTDSLVGLRPLGRSGTERDPGTDRTLSVLGPLTALSTHRHHNLGGGNCHDAHFSGVETEVKVSQG